MSPLPVNPASFVGRSRQEILRRLENKLPKLTDYTYLGEGSIIRGILEAISIEVGSVYSVLNYVYMQGVVTEATGISLDALGALYGVVRRQVSSTASQTAFYFYLANSPNHQSGIPSANADQAFIIPNETIVRTSDDLIGDIFSFKTMSSVSFAQGDSVHYVNITPDSGTLRTNIAPYTLRVHNYTGVGSTNLYCTNPIELSTNSNVEPDEEYRARIIQGVRSLATSNTTALRLAALSVDHVRDAKVIERPFGPATAKVIFAVDYGALGTELADIQTAVEKTRAAGCYVQVTAATTFNVEIGYAVQLDRPDTRDAVSSSVNSAIRSYMGSMTIGQPLRRSQLLERMFRAAPTALDITITSIKVNGVKFIGDSYQIPEDSIFTTTSVTQFS
jgi:uncharacterized phage protein gp47/JayE